MNSSEDFVWHFTDFRWREFNM